MRLGSLFLTLPTAHRPAHHFIGRVLRERGLELRHQRMFVDYAGQAVKLVARARSDGRRPVSL
jgi:hypothetical protein